MDNKKLKAALEVLLNVSVKYPETAWYIKESNEGGVRMGEIISWRGIYFVVSVLDYGCLYLLFACL